ncbi:hypothetical protein MHYP_G00211370 [Metynnis hypsauchen]
MCVSVGQDTKRREPLAFDQTPLGTALRSPGDQPLVLLIGSTLTGGHSPDTNQSHGTKHDLQPIIKSGDGVISMKGFQKKGLPREDRKKELQDDSATTEEWVRECGQGGQVFTHTSSRGPQALWVKLATVNVMLATAQWSWLFTKLMCAWTGCLRLTLKNPLKGFGEMAISPVATFPSKGF